MECTAVHVSPVPQPEVDPTAHPVAKKIVSLLQNDGSCCLFGTMAEVANFLWGNQEFIFGSQSVQASELIDPDNVREPYYEGTVVLEDGTDARIVLEPGGRPSLASRVSLLVKFQSCSDILQGSLTMRMGSVERAASEARWTFVGIEDVAELPVLDEVYVRCGKEEVSLDLEMLQSCADLRKEVSVLIQGVSVYFAAQIDVEEPPVLPPVSPTTLKSGDERQWRLSIEVRSLKLRVAPAKVFAKYSYQCLEQTKPFRTNPPVMARKNTTIHFPNSFSSYHFPRRKETDLRRSFAHEMLRIEIWQRETYTSDTMIGHAFFDLSTVFEQPLKHDASKPNMGLGFRLLDLVSSVECDNESKGVLRLLVFLEDLGGATPTSPPLSAPKIGDDPKEEELRDGPSYSTAVELELWKRNEEAKFRVHLQEEERVRKRHLEEEYEEKERVRSLEFHAQKQQMVKLEQTLRLKLQEVLKREQQLQAATVKIRTEKDVTERQRQITKEQAALETKLLRQEMDQNLKLDHTKSKKFAGKIESLEEDINLWRQRYSELEEKFIAHRKHVAENEAPLEQLRAEIKIKQFEIEDLHRKHAVISASRDHFKNAVRTLLMELEKERKKVSSLHLAQTEKNPPYIADNSSSETDDVVHCLHKLKNDLAELQTATPDAKVGPAHEPAKPSAWESMRREFLGSGLYTENDRMFKYLKGT